jgi:hypothetical protein
MRALLCALALALLAGCTGGTEIVLPPIGAPAQTPAQAAYAANHPDDEGAQAPEEVDF